MRKFFVSIQPIKSDTSFRFWPPIKPRGNLWQFCFWKFILSKCSDSTIGQYKSVIQNHWVVTTFHMISNCWTWPTVSMCFHSASPVHIAALVPQCICLHLCFFLCLYFCVSASGLVASVSLVCLTIVSYHCLSFCLSFYLFAYISDSPSFYLSFCLSICLSENLIENELTDWLKWRSRNSKFTGGPWLRGSKSSGISIKRALIGD